MKSNLLNLRFTGADGAEHLVTYIADEKGYRVVGDAKIGGPKTISRTTQPPIQPPTRPPTRPPTQAPVIQEPKATKATVTRAPATKAPAVVQVVPVQALPLRQAIQFIQVPQQFSSGLINGASADLRGGSGFQQLPVAGYSGLCGLPLKVNGEQEVLGQDGTRYVLKKVENQ